MKYFVKKAQAGAASHSLSSDLSPILDSINDGVFTVDEGFRITSFNRAAAEIIGITPEEALGRPCWSVFNADICEGTCALKETMATVTPLVNKQVNIHTSARRKVSISVSTALLRNQAGDLVGGVESFRDLTVVEELRRAAEGRATFRHMTSTNHRMTEIFKLLPLIAQSDSTVLIHGESGTGKELVADAIHAASPRAGGPLVKVNCAALVETLLLSELFGHEKGAFTGAAGRRRGRFEAADGGTIFLDEIGDISPRTQVALLRVLQDRTFERVGGTTPVRVDVRIVCATHRDLRAMVARGEFREDLYYRLHVFPIEMPRLRDRLQDLPALCEQLLARIERLTGTRVELTPRALEGLAGYAWPGNVRELGNLLERLAILHAGRRVELSDLPEKYRPGMANVSALARRAMPEPLPDGGFDLKDHLTQLEQRYIREALARADGTVAGAARLLGMQRTTLVEKLKKYRLADADVA
jgi:PAS domain S-box-containing protein